MYCGSFTKASETSEQKGDEKAADSENGKAKKDEGAPAKKKKQQVKTIDLRVETYVPRLTEAQLRDATDREVCSVETAPTYSL